MAVHNTDQIEAAEVVLPCTALDDTLAFFTDTLGFRVTTIFPADDPAVAVLTGHGLRLRLERGAAGGGGEGPNSAGVLRLLCRDPAVAAAAVGAAVANGSAVLTAPNGTRVELVAAAPPLVVPPVQPSFVVTTMAGDGHWVVGRAGMHYRDLVPDRQGGYVIASHIRIAEGGPVPDYVHFHQVQFQMIYCTKGWVRLVYEDQGPPFVLAAGDCVLQPPEIRHRVLEASAGLEVIEVGCPAEHLTSVDHALELPTPALRPDREFGSQHFVRHVAAAAQWQPWRLAGFEARDTGIGAATGGLAGARVIRPSGPADAPASRHDASLLFMFVLAGGLTLDAAGQSSQTLAAGDACVVPAGLAHAMTACSADLELLEVAMPAVFRTGRSVV